MSAPNSKSRRRTPTDTYAVPTAAADHAPALTGEQLRVLHQVYGIILAHSKPAGAA
jgi:hypothetical protein